VTKKKINEKDNEPGHYTRTKASPFVYFAESQQQGHF